MRTKERAGRVFAIGTENPWVPGCTISDAVSGEDAAVPVIHFSLAPHTGISREIYESPKFWIVARGAAAAEMEGQESVPLREGDLFAVPRNIPVGISTGEDGIVYTEVIFGKETRMNELVKSGAVFALKDLVPYQEGKIVNMDILHDDHGKLALLSFSAGTGLPEHAAPGDALIFALDGEGIIGYEGKEYEIHAGENFRFDRGGRHYVKASSNFKMALLLTV